MRVSRDRLADWLLMIGADCELLRRPFADGIVGPFEGVFVAKKPYKGWDIASPGLAERGKPEMSRKHALDGTSAYLSNATITIW